MAKTAAIIFLVSGLLGSADLAWSLARGEVQVMSPGGSFTVHRAERSERPEEFQRLIVYEALRCALLLAAGWFFLRLDRKWDRLDPFSTSYKGATDVDPNTPR